MKTQADTNRKTTPLEEALEQQRNAQMVSAEEAEAAGFDPVNFYAETPQEAQKRRQRRLERVRQRVRKLQHNVSKIRSNAAKLSAQSNKPTKLLLVRQVRKLAAAALTREADREQQLANNLGKQAQ